MGVPTLGEAISHLTTRPEGDSAPHARLRKWLSRSRTWLAQNGVWLALATILVFTAGIRIRLLSVSLERDEGEYAYAGQLLLQGLPPYAEAYNMKMPGIYASYALIMAVSGETHTGIHWGLLFMNAAAILLVFFLGRRLFDARVGVIAAAAYAVMSLSQNVLGFTANAEHFVLLPALAGTVVLLRATESARAPWFFLAGLLLGLAFLMKQHGVFFILSAGAYLLYLDWKSRPIAWGGWTARWLLFSAGIFLPFAAACLYLYRVGVFGKFWFWVFQYAAEYVSLVPAHIGITRLPESLAPVIWPCLWLWVFAGVGTVALWRDPRARPHAAFMAIFLAGSLLSICPGFYFRHHYFLLLLPPVALCAAAGLCWSSRLLFAGSRLGTGGGLLLFTAAALIDPVRVEAPYLFLWSDEQVARSSYEANPFPESLVIGDYLKRHTAKTDRIAVIGSEPQIYFYAQRRSATGHIYTYALMEDQPFARQMQEEMSREIEAHAPAFLVYVHHNSSWLRRKKSEPYIFDWFEEYRKKFELVGLVVFDGEESAITTRCYWDADARKDDIVKGERWVSILKRKP